MHPFCTYIPLALLLYWSSGVECSGSGSRKGGHGHGHGHPYHEDDNSKSSSKKGKGKSSRSGSITGVSKLGTIVGVVEDSQDGQDDPPGDLVMPLLLRESSTGSLDSYNGPSGRFDRLDRPFYVLNNHKTSAPSPQLANYSGLGLPTPSSSTSSSKPKTARPPVSSSSSSSDSSGSDDSIDVNKIVKQRKRGGSLGALDSLKHKSHRKRDKK